MTLSDKMQIFLIRKLREKKLGRKDFVQESGIPLSTVAKIIKADHSNPELKTILRVANHFNCSIDEVIGRDSFMPTDGAEFDLISIAEAQSALKRFVQQKLEDTKLSVYQLGKKCGFSEHALVEFMKENSTKTLGSEVTVGLANYFDISMDEMIGRRIDRYRA